MRSWGRKHFHANSGHIDLTKNFKIWKQCQHSKRGGHGTKGRKRKRECLRSQDQSGKAWVRNHGLAASSDKRSSRGQSKGGGRNREKTSKKKN